MNIDFAEMADFTKDTVLSAPDVPRGMQRLLEYCESSMQQAVLERIRQLDFKDDELKLRGWLEKVLSSEPPSNEINAFYFGLFNPVLENGRESMGLYVSGSTRFDPNDESGDWAAWDDDSYLPDSRYANSNILTELYHSVAGTDMANVGEYVLCLGYSGLTVNSICRSLDQKLLLGGRNRRDIAVGFDSGDFIILNGIEKQE